MVPSEACMSLNWCRFVKQRVCLVLHQLSTRNNKTFLQGSAPLRCSTAFQCAQGPAGVRPQGHSGQLHLQMLLSVQGTKNDAAPHPTLLVPSRAPRDYGRLGFPRDRVHKALGSVFPYRCMDARPVGMDPGNLYASQKLRHRHPDGIVSVPIFLNDHNTPCSQCIHAMISEGASPPPSLLPSPTRPHARALACSTTLLLTTATYFSRCTAGTWHTSLSGQVWSMCAVQITQRHSGGSSPSPLPSMHIEHAGLDRYVPLSCHPEGVLA